MIKNANEGNRMSNEKGWRYIALSSFIICQHHWCQTNSIYMWIYLDTWPLWPSQAFWKINIPVVCPIYDKMTSHLKLASLFFKFKENKSLEIKKSFFHPIRFLFKLLIYIEDLNPMWRFKKLKTCWCLPVLNFPTKICIIYLFSIHAFK